MKVRLMHPDADFEVGRSAPPQADDVAADLGLAQVWEAMAGDDRFLLEVSRAALFQSLDDPEIAAYRQDVLADLRTRPDVARALYDVAGEALAGERRIWGSLRRTPSATLHRSVQVLGVLAGALRTLRELLDGSCGTWASEGMRRLEDVVGTELDDAFFAEVDRHLATLAFGDGIWMSARLGGGNKGTDYVLRTPPEERRWREWLHLPPSTSLSFDVHPRDEAGLEALDALRSRGLNQVANALAQSADHVLGFFTQLRAEAGFYVSCLHLEARVTDAGMPVCRPQLRRPASWPCLSATGLYDGALALRTQSTVVANDLDADGRGLVMVTGANSGGKSTFLRGVGLAQLMAQCGMPVFATRYESTVATGLFTHFARSEDAAMEHGRFDDELLRMRAIVDRLAPGSVVLFNESFAGTNEWEASEIARQVVRALIESGVRVFFVTHLYDLARTLYEDASGPVLFLRAERLDSGERSFRMLEGAPLPTSFGPDLYERLGGLDPDERGSGAR